MSDDLSTQAALADIRLRVINRETVSRDEYRALLLDLARNRDATARASRSATAAKSKANKAAGALTKNLDIDSLFSRF